MKVLLLTLFVAFVASAPVEDVQDAVEVVVNGLPEGQALDIGDIVDIKLKEHVDGQVAASSDLLHPYTAVGLAEAAAAVEIEAQPVQIVEVAANEVSPVQIAEVAENEVSPVQVVEVVENEVSPVQVVEPIQVVEHEPIQTLPIIIENEVAPTPVVLPSPVAPEVVPEPVVLPSPVAPEVVPEPVVLPSPVAPEVVPEPVVLPSPVAPEVVPEPVVLPEPVVPDVVPSPVVIPEPVAPEVPEVLPVPEPQLPTGEVYNDGTVSVTVNAPEDGVLSTLQNWVSMVMNYFSNGAQTTQQIL